MQDTDPQRDRPENQTGVPLIEVTPEMIEAGIAVHWNFDAPRELIADQVALIYRAMAMARERVGNGKGHVDDTVVAAEVRGSIKVQYGGVQRVGNLETFRFLIRRGASRFSGHGGSALISDANNSRSLVSII